MRPYDPIPIDEIRAAQDRIAGHVVRTPLVRLNADDLPAEIYLKLENLQPVGSFKIRGAYNAMAQLDPDELADGVWTVSAGNMAQGLAWCARERGISCTVLVPEHAPETKLANVVRLGAKYVKVPFAVFEETFITRHYEGIKGRLIHPFSDPAVMAGNGTIGLEILEDLPDVDAVVIAYAGGGLSCGIGSAIRAVRDDAVKLYAAEVETGAPFAASMAAGRPVVVEHTQTFVDGISGTMVTDEMWPLARSLMNGALVSTLEEVAAAVKLMVERNRVVAEGAGAASVAAAVAGKAGTGKIACIVSGGNIDTARLQKVLQGQCLN
ncbi:MAG: pyridoxal-phosphate dependent enzyme [Chloroflexi bacterium]|nr:pyridoxal-phosphate dependent enzyme [Chloroflexota bacterium]